MAEALLAKLSRFTRLSPEETSAVGQLCYGRLRTYESHKDIIAEGDNPTCVRLLVKGWACRYKTLEDGRRQIIALFLPGDLCDLNIFILSHMDHSIATIRPATVAEIPKSAFEQITFQSPRLTQALWWENLVTSAIQREWALNLGQRTAVERMAHLFCEIFLRLQTVGLTTDNSCEMPLTQLELGEVAGISTVHVNRTIKELHEAGLIKLRSRRLVISDIGALRRAGQFNPNYLHLNHEGRSLDASTSAPASSD